MNRWDEYLAATVRLDHVRRESAATVAAQQAAAGAAAGELTAVRQRIALQRGRLSEIAVGVTRITPAVEPLETERGAAVALLAPTASPSEHSTRVGDATPDINAALQRARATLDAADATLSAATNAPTQRGLLAGRPPGVRNAIVYGWFALLALVAVIEINEIAGSSLQAGVVIALFALIVPAGAWVLGWVSLRLLFGRVGTTETSTAGRRLADASYRPSGGVVGALLCAVPLIVGLILSVI
jgi:hypothetical protein